MKLVLASIDQVWEDKEANKKTILSCLEFAKENLTGYKRPRYVEFMEELPKSNVGKILRKDLRKSA